MDALSWTIADLAKALGVPHATALKWRTGSVPGGDLLAKLPEVLGVSGHWLLTGEGPIEPPGVPVEWEALRRAVAAEEREAVLAAFGEVADAIRERAVAIATGQADPVVEEGVAGGPLRPAVARTLKERLAADAEAIRADQGIRRRRPPAPE